VDEAKLSAHSISHGETCSLLSLAPFVWEMKIELPLALAVHLYFLLLLLNPLCCSVKPLYHREKGTNNTKTCSAVKAIMSQREKGIDNIKNKFFYSKISFGSRVSSHCMPLFC
jgi:hypothetical protein